MSPMISILIPFLNESENIKPLAAALESISLADPSIIYEVLFIDDGSTDDSIQKLLNSNIQNCQCKVIKLSRNYGSHAALRAGLLHATGEFTTFMYADLQDPPELIGRLYQECKQGNNIVWAVRSNSKVSFGDKIFSEMYARLMRKFAVNNFPVKGFDVVMFDRKVQASLNASVEANSSIFLQILTSGFKQGFFEYEKGERKHGKSKWTLSKKIKLFIDSFVAFSYAPIRLVTIVGFVLFLVGLLFSGYLVFRKLYNDDLEQGWAMLISILMIGFGVTNISLGIIAEYLWRTLDTARKRPVFIIDEIIELNKNRNP